MHLRHLGYACQNLSIPCTTGRTFRLKSLTEARAAKTIAENLDGLQRILRWNVDHGIRFFRTSSDIVPFASHPAFPFDWQARFADALAAIRAYVQAHGLRLSMHPGQYTVLNSPRPDVVAQAHAELAYQAAFIEAVDPAQGSLTLHVGGAYGDKAAALDRFARQFERLPEAARRHLTLENDDTTYHVADVLPLCERLGIPVVFDFFHHRCHHPGPTPDAGLLPALHRVVATWGDRVPKFHLSSQKPGTRTAHADTVEPEDLHTFLEVMAQVEGDVFDLMLEAKHKDRALLALRPHRLATT